MRIRTCEPLQKFWEHEQASTRLNFASKSSKGQILRAFENFYDHSIPLLLRTGRWKGPFHLIFTPPLLTNSIKIYPLRKKVQSADTTPPSEINGFFLSPTEKDEFFVKPLRKSGKDQRERTHQPLRNGFPSSFRKTRQRGGGGGGGGVYKMEWPKEIPA